MNKNNPVFRYVNGMLNVSYLTGFVRNPQEWGFYLQQTNNIDSMIPVRVKANMRVPADKTPVTVLAHIFGERNAQGVPNVVARAYDIQKPSVRSMPALTAWVRGGGKESDAEDFRPFVTGAGIKPKLTDEAAQHVESGESFTDDEQIMRDIIEATRGRLDTRLGDNANVVQIAGFVDSMMWVEPNEFQSNGYGAIMLRQHEDTDKNIPVRLYSPAAKTIMKNVTVGLPISVAGQIRMKVIPDDKNPGEKIANMHVRIADVYRVERDKDIKETPDWWASMRDRLKEEFQTRAAARRELSKAAEKTTEMLAADL